MRAVLEGSTATCQAAWVLRRWTGLGAGCEGRVRAVQCSAGRCKVRRGWGWGRGRGEAASFVLVPLSWR